eukprot:scaffold259460_cov30-Tisochrysis_lutea.AAC.4
MEPSAIPTKSSLASVLENTAHVPQAPPRFSRLYRLCCSSSTISWPCSLSIASVSHRQLKATAVTRLGALRSRCTQRREKRAPSVLSCCGGWLDQMRPTGCAVSISRSAIGSCDEAGASLA